MNYNYKNLVFEGGGVKGVAYAGALQTLESLGVLEKIERVAGTSAGAITSCLVSLRYTPAQITTTIKNMDLGSFDDKEGVLKKFHNYGIHPGKTFLEWIKKQIANSNHGFDENATFEDFQKAGCRDLRVFASDIYIHEVREFSFRKTPKVIVAEAVRASMSIPLYFNAWQFSNNNPDNHLYVDGGMVYNYPITAFDEGSPNQETLGLRLEDVDKKRVVNDFGYGHWIKYVKNTFDTLLRAQNIEFNKNPNHSNRSIIIDDLGIGATDFDISDAEKDNLIANGEKATQTFLDNKAKAS